MTALYRSGRQAEAVDAYQDARRALVDGLGIEPGAELRELEQAILRHDPSLDLHEPARASGREAAERSILVVIADETRVVALIGVAEPLALEPPRVMVIARLVPDASEFQAGSAWLEGKRTELGARGVVARAASFTSSEPGADLPASPPSSTSISSSRRLPTSSLWRSSRPAALRTPRGDPCDVALVVSRGATPEGPVLVPFGGGEHDWAAVELGAWLAKANGMPLRLVGAAAVPEQGSATRAVCSRTVLSPSSASWASLPSRCLPSRARTGCSRRAATPASSSWGCRLGGTSRALGQLAFGSREMRPRQCCSCGGTTPRRPRSADRPHALHVVDPAFVRRLPAGRLVRPAG